MPSTSAEHVPRHPAPTSSGDTHKSRSETAGPSVAPIDSSRPSVLLDPTRSVSPAVFPRRLLSVSSPSAPVVESSCPMTCDSRPCRGSTSASSQSLRSSVRRFLRLPCCSSPSCRLPGLPTAKYSTVLPRSSGSSHFWLAQRTWLHCTHPLRSVRFHGLHRYYGVLRPLVSHSYVRPRGSFHLRLFRWHRHRRFPRSV